MERYFSDQVTSTLWPIKLNRSQYRPLFDLKGTFQNEDTTYTLFAK